MNYLKYPVALLALLLLAACSSAPTRVTILPQEKSTFDAIGTAETEAKAIDAATQKAQDKCQSMGRQLVVLKHTSHPADADVKSDTAKTVTSVAKAVTWPLWNIANPDPYAKADLLFTCQ